MLLEKHEEYRKKMLQWLLLAGAAATGIIAGIVGLNATLIALSIAAALLARFIYMLYYKVFTIDLIMSIVGFIGTYLNVVPEVLVIYILYGIAELSEAYIEKLAFRRLSLLNSLVPTRVLIAEGDSLREVDIDRIKVGDVIVVRHGETIPVDSITINKGIISKAMITGEYEPASVKQGENVLAGSVNVGKDPLYVKALKPVHESTIMLLVTTAIKVLEKKTRIQRLIERLAPYYTASLLIVFAILLLFIDSYRAMTILLAGCPSAFIIASSFITIQSVADLASHSILVRGGQTLETLSRVKCVVLDKTGTITLGKLSVAEVKLIKNDSKILHYACAAAKASTHPVSRALSRLCNKVFDEAQEVPGRGIIARVNGVEVVIGSREFITERVKKDVKSLPYCKTSKEVHIAIDGRYSGVICLEEEVDSSALDTINHLRMKGLKIIIASGDRYEPVKKVAKLLGVNEYYYKLNPMDKMELIRRLKNRCSGKVAMIGDGVNDIEALAAADVGIAVGSIDVVAEVSDIIIPGLQGLKTILSHARGFHYALITSFIVIIAMKLTIVFGGLLGLLPLWAVAALGDDGSTIAGVIASALTMIMYRKEK